jgi:hypothetical protein
MRCRGARALSAALVLAAGAGGAGGAEEAGREIPVYEKDELFEARLEALEAQRVVEEASPAAGRAGGILVGRERRLEMDVTWRVTRAARQEAALEGRVAAGVYRLERKTLGALPLEVEILLDDLILEATVSAAGAALEPHARSWKAVVARWQRAVASRRLPARELAELAQEAHAAIREAAALPFSPGIFAARRGAPFRLERLLRSPDGKPAGTLTLVPENDALTAGPDARSFEVPLGARLTTSRSLTQGLVRTLRRPGGPAEGRPPREVDLGETGSVIWTPRAGREPPSWLEIEALTSYEDGEELAGLAVTLPPHRQEHEVRLRHALAGATPPLRRPAAHRPPPPLPFAALLRERHAPLFEKLASLERDPGRIRAVVEEYASMEGARRPDGTARALFHHVLAERLAALAFRADHPAAREDVETILRGESRLAVFLLGLRAVAHPYALLTDEERVARFVEAARRKEPELALWGARYLAEVPWNGALEAIDALRKERAAGDAPEGLRRGLEADRYRLAGARAAPGGAPPGGAAPGGAPLQGAPPQGAPFPYAFLHVVRKAPGKEAWLAEHLEMSGARRIAFLVDTSRAMETALGAAPGLAEGQDIGALAYLRGLTRSAWARPEVDATLATLSPEAVFGIVTFHTSGAAAWKKELEPATKENVRSASVFLSRVELAAGEPAPGGDLAAALPALFRWEDPDTVVVIGADGGDPRVEMELALWNYLRGARLIAFGFAPPDAESPALLQRLARRHFGWYKQVAVR